MRELLTIIATTAALTALSTTPAVAHEGTAKFKSLKACEDSRKKHIETKHKVTPCHKAGGAYVFKYSH